MSRQLIRRQLNDEQCIGNDPSDPEILFCGKLSVSRDFNRPNSPMIPPVKKFCEKSSTRSQFQTVAHKGRDAGMESVGLYVGRGSSSFPYSGGTARPIELSGCCGGGVLEGASNSQAQVEGAETVDDLERDQWPKDSKGRSNETFELLVAQVQRYDSSIRHTVYSHPCYTLVHQTCVPAPKQSREILDLGL